MLPMEFCNQTWENLSTFEETFAIKHTLSLYENDDRLLTENLWAKHLVMEKIEFSEGMMLLLEERACDHEGVVRSTFDAIVRQENLALEGLLLPFPCPLPPNLVLCSP